MSENYVELRRDLTDEEKSIIRGRGFIGNTHRYRIFGVHRDFMEYDNPTEAETEPPEVTEFLLWSDAQTWVWMSSEFVHPSRTDPHTDKYGRR